MANIVIIRSEQSKAPNKFNSLTQQDVDHLQGCLEGLGHAVTIWDESVFKHKDDVGMVGLLDKVSLVIPMVDSHFMESSELCESLPRACAIANIKMKSVVRSACFYEEVESINQSIELNLRKIDNPSERQEKINEFGVGVVEGLAATFNVQQVKDRQEARAASDSLQNENNQLNLRAVVAENYAKNMAERVKNPNIVGLIPAESLHENSRSSKNPVVTYLYHSLDKPLVEMGKTLRSVARNGTGINYRELAVNTLTDDELKQAVSRSDFVVFECGPHGVALDSYRDLLLKIPNEKILSLALNRGVEPLNGIMTECPSYQDEILLAQDIKRFAERFHENNKSKVKA